MNCREKSKAVEKYAWASDAEPRKKAAGSSIWGISEEPSLRG
jgi:hypothetical protein